MPKNEAKNGCLAHHDRQLLPHPRRHKPQHHPPNRQPKPEPRRRHATRERLSLPDLDHELDDPPAERDLEPHVAQQEKRAQPSDARAGACHQSLLEAALDRVVVVARVVSRQGVPVLAPGRRPETGDGCQNLETRHADLGNAISC